MWIIEVYISSRALVALVGQIAQVPNFTQLPYSRAIWGETRKGDRTCDPNPKVKVFGENVEKPYAAFTSSEKVVQFNFSKSGGRAHFPIPGVA